MPFSCGRITKQLPVLLGSKHNSADFNLVSDRLIATHNKISHNAGLPFGLKSIVVHDRIGGRRECRENSRDNAGCEEVEVHIVLGLSVQ